LPFRDVPIDNPYAAAIATARKIGLITGDTSSLTGLPLGTFRPDAPLTNQELHVLERRMQRLHIDTHL
jgi:hypothetical protein